MNNQETIDLLNDLKRRLSNRIKSKEDVALETAISALEAQQADRWIPVTERLPEEYGTYMVAWRPVWYSPEDVKKRTKSNDTHFYEMLEYDPDEDDGWIESIKQCNEYDILAWKPLPEPYKEEQL